MKKLLLLLIPVVALVSCVTTGDSAALVPVESQDLIETGIWTAGGSGGSSVISDTGVVDGEIKIVYQQVEKPGPNEWPDIEVAVSLKGPETEAVEGEEEVESEPLNFYGMEKITIEYKCSEELMIRLNQSDFLEEGDASYALYYTAVFPAEEWTTATVEVAKFFQPSWAEPATKAVPLKLENVSAIALSPQPGYVNKEVTLEVRSLVIE